MKSRHWQHYFRILRWAPYGIVKRITGPTCRGYSAMVPYLRDKVGLEIGGPSQLFAEGQLIPVYNLCHRIDNCTFASQTIWSSPVETAGFGHRLGAIRCRGVRPIYTA